MSLSERTFLFGEQQERVPLCNSAVVSHEKESRGYNQDVCLADDTVGLYGVFDGLGGYRGSEMAAQTTSRVVHEHIARLPRTLLPEQVEQELRLALLQAHYEVRRQQRNFPLQNKMGTTAVVAKVVRTAEGQIAAVVANAGDSRLYLFSKEHGLKRITRDHSLHEDEYIAGLPESQHAEERLRWDNARSHADVDPVYFHQRSGISSYIGMQGMLPPDIRTYTIPLQHSDELWLVSDGISDNCTFDQIQNELRLHQNLQNLETRSRLLAHVACEIMRRGPEKEFRAKPDDASVVSVVFQSDAAPEELSVSHDEKTQPDHESIEHRKRTFSIHDDVRIRRPSGIVESGWRIVSILQGENRRYLVRRGEDVERISHEELLMLNP